MVRSRFCEAALKKRCIAPGKRNYVALGNIIPDSITRIAADGEIHDIHNVRVRDTAAGEIVNFHCRAAPSMSVIKEMGIANE